MLVSMVYLWLCVKYVINIKVTKTVEFSIQYFPVYIHVKRPSIENETKGKEWAIDGWNGNEMERHSIKY